MDLWIIFSILLIISSVILYLLVRKANDLKIPVIYQNLGFFLLPAIIIGLYNIIKGISFKISITNLLFITFIGFLFSWLGNIASLKALKLAPNPGYSLVISKSYVIMTSVLAVWLFDSILPLKSIIAILLVVGFTALIIIDKKRKERQDSKWILLTLGAFLAWGFLALSLKHLVDKGLESTVIMFYLMLIVSIIIGIEIFLKKPKKSNSSLLLLTLIGISSTFFNLFIILGYKYAPNPGFINAANAGSIALVTIFSSLIFKDELKTKKVIGVIGVIVGLIILFI